MFEYKIFFGIEYKRVVYYIQKKKLMFLLLNGKKNLQSNMIAYFSREKSYVLIM